MNSHPLLSVVIPLYNKEPYIARALASVLRQTFPHFEVIVVDDGSTDDSAVRVEGLRDSRVRLMRQPNRGVGAARNRGIAESKGKLIAFLDADDEWLPWHLDQICALAHQFSEAQILANGIKKVKANAAIPCVTDLGESAPILLTPSEYFKRAVHSHLICVSSSSCAVRREVISELGCFIEDMPLGEDQEYWGRICLRYPVAINPRISAYYHFGTPSSASKRKTRSGWYPPVVHTIKRYLAQEGAFCEARQNVQNYAAFVLLHHIARLLVFGNRREAVALLGDDILKGCGWGMRIWRLRLGCRIPMPFLRSYIAVRRRIAS